MRTVVVDLGCADRGEWFSLQALVDEYKPDMLYGFDPSPSLDTRVQKIGDTAVRLQRKAAWIYDGEIEFNDEFVPGGQLEAIGVGLPGQPYGRIGTIGPGFATTVRCFDFAKWLEKHGPAVVKMDIEGAEYQLLEHLIDTGANRMVSELVVEWHDTPAVHLGVGMGCPVRRWWM